MDRDLPQLTAGPRYVYFSSLDAPGASPWHKTIASHAYEMLYDVKQDIQQNNSLKIPNNITYALDFLKNAAQYERTKELQFFQNFNQQFPEAKEFFNIDLSNPSEKDYISFITNINITLKGLNVFKKRLNTEIKRISRVKSYRKTGDKFSLSYNKNDIEKRVNQANIDKLTFFKRGGTSGAKKGSMLGGEQNFIELFERKTSSSRLASTIIQEYGPQLFEYSKNKVALSPKQITALLKVLTDEAYAMLISEYELLSNNTIINARETILGKNSDFEQFFKDLMDSPDLTNILNDIAQQYNLQDNNDDIKIDSDKIKNIKTDLLYQYEKIKSELPEQMTQQEWLKSIGASNEMLKDMYRSIINVSAQAYYTGEDLNLIELARNKIYSALGGRSNPTDDIYAGKLIISPDISINTNILESELATLGRNAYKNIKGLDDLQIFFKNAEILRESREEQKQKLEIAQNKISNGQKAGEFLLSHVNIHTTIKGYTGVEGTSFITEGGFKGASLGSNLNLQLNILNQLADSGGFSLGDLQYLQFAMINAGSQMLGNFLKSSLEDYFSIFVGFLMFNDAELMFEDVSQWIKSQTISSVNDIHLYELNGVTIPSSYLLENTYQSLIKIGNDINSKVKTNTTGVKAALSTYNKGPINNDWETTATTAYNQTHLEIHFLAGFLDILNQISAAMPG